MLLLLLLLLLLVLLALLVFPTLEEPRQPHHLLRCEGNRARIHRCSLDDRTQCLQTRRQKLLRFQG